MKTILVLFVASLLITGQAVKVSGNDGDVTASVGFPDPEPGRFYSSDSGGPALNVCFNPLQTTFGRANTVLGLEEAMTSDSLSKQFSVSVGASGGFAGFSAGTKDSYLHSVSDNDFQFSINFYSRTSMECETTYGAGTEALNQEGLKTYQGGKNPNFRVLCGDKQVSSFQVGAAVVLSFIIEATESSHLESVKASISFNSPFVSVLTQFSQAASDVQNSVSITLKAVQWGGEPENLGKVLVSGESISCSLSNISACEAVASDLVTYVNSDFVNQLGNNTNGIWSSKYEYLGQLTATNSVSQMGLKIGSSLVTSQVLGYRTYLNNLYNNVSVYYNFYSQLNNKCRTQLDFCRESCDEASQNFQEDIEDTYNLLMRYAFQCWMNPGNCKTMIQNRINGSMPTIDYETFHDMVLPALTYNVTVSFNGNSYMLEFSDSESDTDLWSYYRGGVVASVKEKQDGNNWDISLKYSAPASQGGQQHQSWDSHTLDDFFDTSDFSDSNGSGSISRHISVDISGAGNKKNLDVKFKRATCTFPTKRQIEDLRDASEF